MKTGVVVHTQAAVGWFSERGSELVAPVRSVSPQIRYLFLFELTVTGRRLGRTQNGLTVAVAQGSMFWAPQRFLK